MALRDVGSTYGLQWLQTSEGVSCDHYEMYEQAFRSQHGCGFIIPMGKWLEDGIINRGTLAAD